MDLRSVLNNNEGAPKAPPTPQQQHQGRPSQSQSPAQYGYRDYPHPPPHPSPGKPIAHDYPHPPQQHLPQQHAIQQHPPPHPPQQHQPQQHSAGAYMPPSPYQAPGQYPPRAAPPPLQTNTSFHDARSPGSSISGPGQSPYRPVPTPPTNPSSAGGAYPFPPSHVQQEMASPGQRHQYPPAQYQRPRRDSYTQAQSVAAHGPPPYVQHQQQQQQPPPPQPQQQPHPVPQTPPIGTPGGTSHQYIHQRSQSTHSTPTPTSAHSQHQYGPPYAQGSPSTATTRLPSAEYSRHSSQPPTPLGPPQSAGHNRPPAAAGSFAQPPSPYQQRISSMPSAQIQQTQPSPNLPGPAPPLKTHSRRPSSRSKHESPTTDSRKLQQRPLSHHERELSMSVSPKTRLGSLPSNSDRPSAPAEIDPRAAQAASVSHSAAAPAPVPAPLATQNMSIDSDRAVTPAKRKLDDRSMSPGEMEHREPRPPPGEVNGSHPGRVQKSASPAAAKKRRLHRTQPPIWAQSMHILGKGIASQANYVLQARVHAHVNNHVNGKPGSVSKTEHPSRQTSPETTRSQPAGNHHGSVAVEPNPQDILGPWETSITGVKPAEELSKTVADFLFIHVISSGDMNEILSRGDQFEIEAKLGTLIDKDTNQRVEKLIDSECILHDTGRIAFKSSMTEAHHKNFNDFLNQMVVQTDPRAPNGGNRVQVHYKHRREIDRYFDLPTELQNRLPGSMRARLTARNKRVRVRVTYDQKTGKVLNKIMKARVADIDIHFPTSPMDCRISINLEMNWDGSVEELEHFAATQVEKQSDRNKDRLSYTQGHYQIDLTQVTQNSSGPGASQRMEKEHELEIEVAAGMIIEQGRKAMTGAPHRYQELVEGLVDNVRVLSRKAKEFK